MRIRIANYIVIFIFLLMAFWLFNLQVIGGTRYRELSDKNCIRLLPQEGSRGRIFDRRGNILVDNRLAYDLMILAQGESEIDEIIIKASGILGKDPQDLKEKFKGSFAVPFVPVTVAENIDLKKALALEELKTDLSGIVIQPKPRRTYPFGKLAAHVIGYLNEIDRWRLTKLADYGYKTKDIVGFGGIEEKYDYYLRQEEGGASVEVDHQGRFVRLLGFRPPQSGKDIQLTLDLRIQKIIEEILAGRKGCAIIMDPYTGAILALVSSPAFNPEIFVKKENYSIAELFGDSASPLINRAISGLYPAGSVFKLVVATAALETGKINLNTSFYCPGSMNIGREEFSCWDEHHQQNLREAIIHSCNVFFYRTGLLVGPQLIHDYALKFGLARPTLIDLPYETQGLVPNPLWRRIYKFKKWFDGDTANFSVGQGELLVTPLQISRMMAVFANQGYLVTPYTVQGIGNRDVSRQQIKIVHLPFKKNNIELIRQGLRSAVSAAGGTAHILSELPISVAGKTGTAQVTRRQPHGWFTGFFPFKNPKFVITIFLENGGSGYNSSVLAKQIIERMIQENIVE